MKQVGVVLLLMVGCGGPGTPDGGREMDGGLELMHSGLDAALDGARAADGGDSCDGVAEGTTTCSVDSRTCCGGFWYHYIDGACLPGRDAGVEGDAGSPCDSDPEALGCPCTEGAISCSALHYRRVCLSGTWTQDYGFVCCDALMGR